jgi:hypothetical protein
MGGEIGRGAQLGNFAQRIDEAKTAARAKPTILRMARAPYETPDELPPYIIDLHPPGSVSQGRSYDTV